jgi:hypothetical protein
MQADMAHETTQSDADFDTLNDFGESLPSISVLKPYDKNASSIIIIIIIVIIIIIISIIIIIIIIISIISRWNI